MQARSVSDKRRVRARNGTNARLGSRRREEVPGRRDARFDDSSVPKTAGRQPVADCLTGPLTDGSTCDGPRSKQAFLEGGLPNRLPRGTTSVWATGLGGIASAIFRTALAKGRRKRTSRLSLVETSDWKVCASREQGVRQLSTTPVSQVVLDFEI